ncbi:cbb3-type cytochrome c oxidase N-terminal domain-containing protein [Pirellulaceae bacterium SH467]|jgi:cytochrome c oxidase cbb3-type subunit 3
MNQSNTKEVSLGHSYDGIQEYDNPLPGWWKWMFWGTIAFSPLYLMYYHNGAPGRSVADQYTAGVTENTRKQYAEIGDLQGDEATMVKFLKEPKWVGVGQAIFKANCVSCHGPEGGGNVGPNLGDNSFKHIKALPDIVKVINEGVAGGAMPAWGNRFSHKNDAILVSIYVASLRGTNPPGGKAPDGGPIPAWPKD